jgi:thioredoxin 1
LDLLDKNPGLVIVKFSADWCGPCKLIKPLVDGFYANSPHDVICCDIDIEENIDLYAYLKKNKMVNGIPTILMYKRGNKSFAFDDSVVGSDAMQLDAFFKRCNMHWNSLHRQG